jgi:hypothetical protein
MSVPNHFSILQAFWNANASRFNFVHQEDCGKFTEEFLVHLIDETNDYHYAHLRKSGSQTQYNQHAIDVIAYDNRSNDDGTDIMEVDIIGQAESSNASPTWQVRETQYTEADLMQPSELPGGGTTPDTKFPTYEELGGDGACTELIGIPLEADYATAGQPMNAGSSVWVNRTVYDAINWAAVQGIPPRVAYQKSCEKRRPEWRVALGLDPVTGQKPVSAAQQSAQADAKTLKVAPKVVESGVTVTKVEGDKGTVTKVETKKEK